MAITCKLFNSQEYRNLKTCVLSVSRSLQTQQITQKQPGMKCFLQYDVSQGGSAFRAVSSGELRL